MAKATPTNSLPKSNEISADRVMRITEFCNGLGIGRSTYYKLLREGKIEQPLKLSLRARGHLQSYFKELTQAMREQS